MSDARLPLFPLRLVLLPGEPVPLHIFEPRYRQMTRECLDADHPFGIVQASEEGTSEIGTAARIVRVVTRYDDGRSDIVVAGAERFRVLAIHRDQPYLTADVAWLDDDDDPPPAAVTRERVIARHMKLLELAGEPVVPALYDSAPALSFIVARRAGLDLAERQRLIEMTHESDRLEMLAGHLEALLQRIRRARVVRDVARGDGHAGPPPTLGDG